MPTIESLNKTELLTVLESVPLSYRPPRPTRQDKVTIVFAIRQAFQASQATRDALHTAWERQRSRKATGKRSDPPSAG